MSRTFNFKLVLLALGALLLIEAVAMFIATGVAYLYDGYDAPYFMTSSLITFVSGLVAVALGYKAEKRLGRREGYIIVALVWVVFAFFGALPFWLSKAVPTYTDAFFETMSGFTTTGATVIPDVEIMPHGILFWRSLTHWIGGMGIIVMSLAILPLFGLGGMQLYAAEATGPTYEKLRPRIKDTAKLLWGIYMLLTLVECVLLKVFGMSWFDAVCHSFSTMGTGGYSTKNASIAAFASPAIEYVVIVFMFLSGINFALLYYVMRGKVSKLWNDEEARAYLFGILTFTVLIAAGLMVTTFSAEDLLSTSVGGVLMDVEKVFRTALFQVVSLMTTTGFATADYMLWPTVLWVLCLFIMPMGASAGSTAGGIKWVRLVILIKNSYYEFLRLIHPNAVIPVRYNGRTISTSVVNNVLAFVILYALICIMGVVLFCLCGIGFDEAIGATFTSLGNVGPGLGMSGPVGNFAHFPIFGKWLMGILMLIGRLELFTVLFLFMPSFWKK